MKKHFAVIFIAITICLASCQPVPQTQAGQAAITPILTIESTSQAPTQADQAAISPTLTIDSTSPIQPYQDVRYQDFSGINVKLDEPLMETLWFNESTKWPDNAAKMAANAILERGKNPGLGIRKLHEQGITGKGVNVAIIDQNLVPDHPEFQGKIAKYFDVGTKQPADQGSMHGPAVTSLLVGENIGTAPGAKVYFAAAPSWTADAQYYADALDWIVNENEKLPEGGKIRVVSVSAAPSGSGSPFTINNAAWDSAYARATQAGLLILDCTTDHGIAATCYYDPNDPDNVAKCTPGWPGMSTPPMPGRLFIPSSFRTTAEEYSKGDFSYQYTGRGGLSWSIPYLSGVLALGWQVRPEMTNSQIMDLLFKSAYTTEGGQKIINPAAFIDMVKGAGSQ